MSNMVGIGIVFIFFIFMLSIIFYAFFDWILKKDNPNVEYRLSDDELLNIFIKEKCKELNLNIKNGIPSISQKRRIIMIISSIITLLILVFVFIYHNYFMSVLFVEGVNVSTLIYLLMKNNTLSYLKKKIKESPDDNMENIITDNLHLSEKNNVISRINNIFILVMPFIITIIIFNKPYTIYEKHGNNYYVRYHTLSLFNDENVVIPSRHNDGKVVGIRGNVFINLINIKTVQLPDTILEIRGEAFKNCYSLKSINLPERITEIKGSTFENDSSLETIVIPEGVTRIGGHAFYGCSSLYSVSVPSTVKEIGSSAFRMCKSLKNISIPQNALVNERAFKESPTRITRY